MSNTRQAADRIHEDQLLNFLVNAFSEETTVVFANNATTDAETIFEVPVGACADRTSVSSLCRRSTASPHENTVLHHLRKQFDLETIEQTADRLMQSAVPETLPP